MIMFNNQSNDVAFAEMSMIDVKALAFKLLKVSLVTICLQSSERAIWHRVHFDFTVVLPDLSAF